MIPTADYEMSILPLASVDEETHIATTAAAASRPIGKVKFVPISAWVENVLEVLDQPGEWAVNLPNEKSISGRAANEPSENIVAPALTRITARRRGNRRSRCRRYLRSTGLIFRGLTFSHAELYPWHGDTGWALQHHWEMFDRPTAALRFRGAGRLRRTGLPLRRHERLGPPARFVLP